MQCQLFLSHLFLSDLQRHTLQENNGQVSDQFFFAGRGGVGGVCVCVLRGVVSWSDLRTWSVAHSATLVSVDRSVPPVALLCDTLYLLMIVSIPSFGKNSPTHFLKRDNFGSILPCHHLGYSVTYTPMLTWKTLHPPLFLAKLGTTAQSSSLPGHHKWWQLAVWSKKCPLSDCENQ